MPQPRFRCHCTRQCGAARWDRSSRSRACRAASSSSGIARSRPNLVVPTPTRSVIPAPLLRHTRAPPRVSRRAQHQSPEPPPPTEHHRTKSNAHIHPDQIQSPPPTPQPAWTPEHLPHPSATQRTPPNYPIAHPFRYTRRMQPASERQRPRAPSPSYPRPAAGISLISARSPVRPPLPFLRGNEGGGGGGNGAWCPPRRDTRGERRNDGSFCAGLMALGARSRAGRRLGATVEA